MTVAPRRAPHPVRSPSGDAELGFDHTIELYVRDVRDLLGLDRWDVHVSVCAPPDDVPNAPVWHGDCVHSQRTMTATVRLRTGLSPIDARRTIFHELLHVRMGLLQQTAERIVALMPETIRTHAWSLFEDALERTIEEIARALHEGITPPEA